MAIYNLFGLAGASVGDVISFRANMMSANPGSGDMAFAPDLPIARDSGRDVASFIRPDDDDQAMPTIAASLDLDFAPFDYGLNLASIETDASALAGAPSTSLPSLDLADATAAGGDPGFPFMAFEDRGNLMETDEIGFFLTPRLETLAMETLPIVFA